MKPVIGAPSAKENFRSIVCVACSVGSVFFLKVMVACILRSGMSASAFTATVPGWFGAGGIRDHTVEPKLTAGFCGLSAEAINIAARPADGAGAADWVGGVDASGAEVAGAAA